MPVSSTTPWLHDELVQLVTPALRHVAPTHLPHEVPASYLYDLYAPALGAHVTPDHVGAVLRAQLLLPLAEAGHTESRDMPVHAILNDFDTVEVAQAAGSIRHNLGVKPQTFLLYMNLYFGEAPHATAFNAAQEATEQEIDKLLPGGVFHQDPVLAAADNLYVTARILANVPDFESFATKHANLYSRHCHAYFTRLFEVCTPLLLA